MRIAVKNIPVILYVIFLLTIPILGKTLDFTESSVFFVSTIAFALYYLVQRQSLNKALHPLFVLFQIALVVLFAISTVHSQNISSSYYALFRFIAILILVDLSIFYFSLEIFKKLSLIFSLFYSFIFWLDKISLIHLPILSFQDNFIHQVWGHSYLADFLVIPLIILFQRLIDHKKQPSFAPIFTFIFLLITLFTTNSRSGIFAFLIGAIVFIYKQKVSSIKIILIPIITLITLLIINFSIIQNPSKYNKFFLSSRPTYWQTAIFGFIKSPVIGLGPSTFFIKDPTDHTIYTHSALLQYLYENGIIFTLVFYGLIGYCLWSHRHSPLLFSINCAVITHSFLDPTWNSVGIMTISLVLLFIDTPLLANSHSKILSRLFFIVFTLIIFIFTLSKTLSDYFYFLGDYDLSLKFDRLNLNSQINTIQDPTSASLSYSLSKQEPLLLQKITQLYDPKDYKDAFLNCLMFTDYDAVCFDKLFNYFVKTSQYDEAINLIHKYPVYLAATPQNQPRFIKLYELSLQLISSSPQTSTSLLTLLNNTDPEEGHFYIELANQLWHQGQKDQAYSLLNKCVTRNSSPSPQCQQYLDSHQESDFDQPGGESVISYLKYQYLSQPTH